MAKGNDITDKQLMDVASFISAWPPYRRKELVMLIMSVDIGKASIEKTLFKYMTKLQEAKEEENERNPDIERTHPNES